MIADKTLSFGCKIKYDYLDMECIDIIVWKDHIRTDSISIMKKHWCYWCDSMTVATYRTEYDYVVATKEMYNEYSDVYPSYEENRKNLSDTQ